MWQLWKSESPPFPWLFVLVVAVCLVTSWTNFIKSVFLVMLIHWSLPSVSLTVSYWLDKDIFKLFEQISLPAFVEGLCVCAGICLQYSASWFITNSVLVFTSSLRRSLRLGRSKRLEFFRIFSGQMQISNIAKYYTCAWLARFSGIRCNFQSSLWKPYSPVFLVRFIIWLLVRYYSFCCLRQLNC